LSVSGALPLPRVKHSMIMIGNFLLLFGGQDPIKKTFLNDMHVLNLETKVWSQVNIQDDKQGSFTPLPRCSFSITPLSSTRFRMFFLFFF
jgi:hypothetical protein